VVATTDNGGDNGDEDGTATRTSRTNTPDEGDEDDETETPDEGDNGDGNGGNGDVENYYNDLENLANDINERITESQNQDPPDPEDLDAQKDFIIGYFEEQKGILDDAVGELEDLDVPGDVEDLHNDFIAGIRDEIDQIDNLIGDVENQDSEDLVEFFQSLDISQIAAEATAACNALQEDAQDRNISINLQCSG
jgi:hypothetical protein